MDCKLHSTIPRLRRKAAHTSLLRSGDRTMMYDITRQEISLPRPWPSTRTSFSTLWGFSRLNPREIAPPREVPTRLTFSKPKVSIRRPKNRT